MVRSKRNVLSRRGFVKKSAAAALALGVMGPAVIIPGRAQQKTLKILKWKHFVPESDRLFHDVFVKEWGEKNGTNVIVENVGLGEIGSRAAAEAQSKHGHDLVLLLTPAPAFEDSLIDHREIFEECVLRYGRPVDAAYKTCYNPKTKKYNGFCTGILPSLLTYRKDLWDAIHIAPDS